MTRTLPSGSPRAETLSSRAAGVQAGAKSVAAPLVRADPRNVEVLADFQPVNAGRDPAVFARLLDAWAEIRVSQCGAVSVPA